MIVDHISEAVSVVSSVLNANVTLPKHTTPFSLPQGSVITVSSCLFICVGGRGGGSVPLMFNISISADVVSFTLWLLYPR